MAGFQDDFFDTVDDFAEEGVGDVGSDDPRCFKLRATALGTLRVRATRLMRQTIPGAMTTLSRRTRDTVECDTPAFRAMSFVVTATLPRLTHTYAQPLMLYDRIGVKSSQPRCSTYARQNAYSVLRGAWCNCGRTALW